MKSNLLGKRRDEQVNVWRLIIELFFEYCSFPLLCLLIEKSLKIIKLHTYLDQSQEIHQCQAWVVYQVDNHFCHGGGSESS